MEWYATHAGTEDSAEDCAAGGTATKHNVADADAPSTANDAAQTEQSEQAAEGDSQLAGGEEILLVARQEVRDMCAHVESARVPGRDSDYNIDLAHQVRPRPLPLAA